MRNSMTLVKKSALIALAFAIIALVGLFPLAFNATDAVVSEPIVAYAANASSGTWLSGKGLQVGNNTLVTNADTTDGYISGSGSYTNCRDFYVTSCSEYEFSAAALKVNNGTVTSKLWLYNESTEGNQSLGYLYGGVFYAIKDTAINVNAVLGGSITNLSTSAIAVSVKINWYASSSSGVTKSVSTTHNLTGGESDVSLSNTVLSGISNSSIANGSYFEIVLSSSGYFSVASPTLEIQADCGNTLNIGDQIVYEISGKNRVAVGATTVGTEGDNSYYIKSGDTITLRAKAFRGESTSLYIFPDYYQAIFDIQGNSGIYWNIYTYSSNGQKDYETTYLSKVNGTGGVSSDGDWYETKYIVQSGAGNVSSIYLEPTVYTRRDGNGKTAVTKQAVVFNVDDSAPAAPTIDSTSELGIAIENSTWYTGSNTNSPYIELTPTTHTVLSYEFIYAFVVPTDVITLSGLSDYDFTPGNAAEMTYEQGKTTTRQELVQYTSSGSKTVKQCTFERSGEWGLVLISVDSAGNVSDPTYYNSYNYNPVYIDGSKYEVGTTFLLGSSVISNATTLGSVYIITGNGTHNDDGSLIEGEYHLNNVYKRSTMRTSVARLQWVTIRIAMSANQFEKYQMVSYTNKGSINGTEITFTPPSTNGRPYYFDLPSFQVTDDFVTNDQAGIIDCVFRSCVELSLIGAGSDGTVYETFTGTNISIADSVEVHKLNDSSTLIQGLKIDVDYFELYQYVVFPNAAGGGTVNFNGVVYTFDESYNLLDMDTAITFGWKTYKPVGSYTRNQDKDGLKNYTIKCYCPSEPRVDSQGYSLGFVDAGSYWYVAAVNEDEVQYYGTQEGMLIINKASPNVSDLSANELTYGVSDSQGRMGLELLEFESISQYGNRLTYGGGDNRYIFGITYYDSYYGVLGTYTITNPSSEDTSYRLPNVSDAMTITVRFTPITITKGSVVNGCTIDDEFIAANYGIMSRYYELLPDGTYELKEGGLHSGNYDSQVLILDIVVSHALVSTSDIVIASSLSVPYTGDQQGIALTTTPANLPYILLYKEKDADDSTYTSDKPFNAGEYIVKYYIDSSKCNYCSDAQEVTFTIAKRELDLNLTSYTNITNTPYTVEGYDTFTERVDVNYGYFTRPALEASYVNSNGVKVVVNVVYYISYMMVEDHAGNKIVSPVMGDRIEEDLLDSTSVPAGLYVVVLSVNNTNNSGAITCLVRIAQATSSGSSNLLISYPSLNSTYSAYTLKQNSVMSVGSDSTIGNIEYGQTIAEKQEGLIVLTDGTIGQYMYRGDVARTYIPGRFYLESEDTILARYGLSTITNRNAAGDLILPVRYEEASVDDYNNIAPYEIYLYWQAGEYDEETGDFIPNNNFGIERMGVTFYVVRATPKFETVTLSTITYGQSLDSSHFQGEPAVSGGMSIGGIGMDGNSSDVKALCGTTFVGKNVLVGYQANGAVAYVLGYELPSSTVYAKGTYDVDCIFIPFNEFAQSYCKVIAVKIKINISAKPATITFVEDENGLVSHDYGASYANPEVVTDPAGVSVRFEFYTLDDEEFILSSTTAVGQYKVKAIIDDDNYQGELLSDFYVVRSALYLSIAPTNAPQYYGVKLGEISLSPGRCFSVSNIAVDGTFAFVNADAVPEVGTAYYDVAFTPNDATAYSRYKEYVYKYALTINKASVEIVYSDLTHTYDGTGKKPTLYAEDPDGNELPVNITYTNWVPTEDTPIPVNANSYTLNLEVNTNHYYNSINVTMVIKKAVTYIDETPQYAKYTGAARPYTPIFDVEGITYTLIYANYFGSIVAAPVEVGEYTVTVTVAHENYQGMAIVKFYVEPYSYTLNNLEQTYDPFGNAEVTADFVPEDIAYKVLYRSVGAAGVFSESLPTEAGQYDVILRIEQNGYVMDKTTMNVDGQDTAIVLNIKPAPATISATEFYRVYTARAHNDLVCDVTPSVSTSYKYRVLGSEDEFTSTAPILAGYYEVFVEISDKNYQGSAYTTLHIDKATPIIGSIPAIVSTNSFNTSKDDVVFSSTGSVIFAATGEYITTKGHWEIDIEEEVYTLMPVGTHNVNLKFVPDDTDNFYSAGYFDTASAERATIDLIISKKDIGSYISFDVSQLSQKYKAKQLSVDAFLTDTSILVENYTIPSIVVTYNGQQIKPKTVGVYTLGAYIIDDNYTGNAVSSKFEITRADLTVVEPKLSTIGVGKKLGDNATLTGGYAYIAQDEGTVMATVDGEFEFTYPDTVFPRANYQKIWVTFMPDDVYNHNVHNFQMEIFVVGESVTLEDVVATGITYGQKLSDSVLSCASSSVSGTFSWEDPDLILTTGEKGKYIFTPEEHDTYNIVTGEVEVEVAQADMWIDQTTLVAKIYVVDQEPFATLSDAVITMDIYHNDHQLDADWLVSGATVKFASGTNFSIKYRNAGESIPNVRIEVSHRDYKTQSMSITVRTYKEVNENNFQIGSTSKIYDGLPVSVADMDIRLADTSYQLTSDDYEVIMRKDGALISEMVDAGEYDVTVSIKTKVVSGKTVEYRNVAFDGSYSFKYNINKLDISSSITASQTSKIYGDYNTQVLADFGEYNIDKEDVIFSYYSYDMTTTVYGVIAPQSAGTYKVKISIGDGCIWYKGEAVFDYTILKSEASISLKQSYVTTYGLPFSIVPDISNNITAENYTVTYNGSATVPENVGEYKVVFTIVHPNFKGGATTYLSIRQATPTISEKPTLSAITYGQELYNSIITGGVVVYGSSAIAVEGEFVFDNPDDTSLAAGTNQVAMIFKPSNTNYSSITLQCSLTVLKGKAAIELVTPTAIYDGTAKEPGYITQPLSGLDAKLVFRQNTQIKEPILAGEYEVTITIADTNYEGSAVFTFTIVKATAVDVTAPSASNLSYGQSLEYSSLSGGSVIYKEGGKAIAGSFAWKNAGLQPGDVGKYNDVKYIFTPVDTDNYEVYEGSVTVTVIKATATIRATKTTFTYGDHITAPVFETEPANLNVRNNEFVNSGLLGEVPHVGTYEFNAQIEDGNYEGSVTYVISVGKKLLDVDFVNSNNVRVDRYTTKYNSVIYAKAAIDTTSLVSQDITSLDEISAYITYYYSSKSSTGSAATHIPPVEVGEYEVYCDMTHADYYIDSSSTAIAYIINRATVEYLEFDSSSLSGQTYGNVSVPLVVTSPANIAYTVSFPGYAQMPTDAGTYSIKVLVVDDNYEPAEKSSMFRILPKDVTIESITCTNRVVDGTPNVTVKGELKGVLVGDEVILSMKAETADGDVNPGTYAVKITSYELSGLHAANYNVLEPIYSLNVKFKSKAVYDASSGSYVTSNNGLSENVTVTFTAMEDSQNKSNLFSTILGQDAIVESFEIKENGIRTTLSEKVKVYVKIPEKFRSSENLVVEGLGDLSTEVINFTREGDFITFYTDKSGEVIIYSEDFPYWVIIVIAVVAMIVIGVICVFIFWPIKRRKRVPAAVRRMYEQQQAEQKRINKLKKPKSPWDNIMKNFQ